MSRKRTERSEPLAATLDRLYAQSQKRREEQMEFNQQQIPEFDGHTCRLPGCSRPPRAERRKLLPPHRENERYETCSTKCAAEFAYTIKQELEPAATPLVMWRTWGRWVGLEMDIPREEFIRHQSIHRAVAQQNYIKEEPFHAP